MAKKGQSTSAVQKALALLTSLSVSESSLTAEELAQMTRMPQGTVTRLVRQLAEIDIVELDIGSDKLVVGPAAQDLAIKFLRAATDKIGVHKVMTQLVGTIQESCNLAVVCGAEVLYIDRVECDWPFRVEYTVGSRLPIHCTAAGKLMLAWMPSERRERLIRRLILRKYTENTITDPYDLLVECEEIRKVGVSIYNEEFHRGEIGVAVPIRNSADEVIAALAVHAPVFRMSILAARSVEPELHTAANKIGKMLSSR